MHQHLFQNSAELCIFGMKGFAYGKSIHPEGLSFKKGVMNEGSKGTHLLPNSQDLEISQATTSR
jgi:hypothetical protein